MNGDAWAAARSVLCVRLDTIGDVLMMTPAIRALKESGTRRVVTLLTSSRGALVAPLIPEIDDVVAYDPPWMKASPAGAAHDFAVCELLRARGFDAAVIFTTYSQSPLPAAVLLHLADVPLRLAHCRENPYQLLTQWVDETEPHLEIRHEVRRQLDLVATVGAVTSDESLSLRVPEEARRRVRRLLAESGMTGAPYVVVHPGASAQSRRYPERSFGEVIRRLAKQDGLQIVLTGDADEAELVESVRGCAPGSVSLAGRLSLAELSALIADAVLVISNNTAPAHIACATGTSLVDLYALTNPQHTPWGAASRTLSCDVPCKYCYRSICPEGHHDCLRLIDPGTVVNAARSLLSVPALR